MSGKFDELAKGLAQSVTRRQALKKFGVGLVGVAVACFGLANKGEAQTGCVAIGYPCRTNKECCSGSCIVAQAKGPNSKICWYQKV